MGKHYGEILYKNGISLKDLFHFSNEEISFAKECLPIYETYLKDIMEEVKGLADGLRCDYIDVATWLINIYCNKEDHGCSVFAYNDNNNIFLARNMDMFPSYKKTSESIVYVPKDKYSFIGHSTSMIMIEDGINEYGLSIALTFLLSKDIKPGINGGFLLRKILEEAKTIEEAIDIINKLPISSSHNIVIADSEGNLALCEINSFNKVITRSNKYVIATNHYNSDSMKIFNNKDDNWYLTKDRYHSLYNYLHNNKNININDCLDLISNKYGFICDYPKNLNFDTIWSSVYDIKNKDIYIAEGNPIKTKFKKDKRSQIIFSKM